MAEDPRRGMTRGGPRYGMTSEQIAEKNSKFLASLPASGKMDFARWKLSQTMNPSLSNAKWQNLYKSYLAKGGRSKTRRNKKTHKRR
jgi:hypothetical protein